MKQKVGLAIIGFGRFAEKAIAPAIRACRNAELVALQKRSLEEARRKASEHDVRLAFASVEDAVAHPEVDAVFIVSANSCHHRETLCAARAGKHILVEKPMSVNVREAEEMIAACAEHHVQLMVGHMLRFSPLLIRMREIIRAGMIGRVHSARADFIYDARLSQRGWLLERSIAGGGPVFDVGVHCLDTLRFVLEDEVTSVRSELEPWPSPERTESTGHLLLRFSRGAIGSIFCSYVSPVRRTFIEIVGEDGILSARDFTLGSSTPSLMITLGRGEGPEEKQEERITVPNLYIEEVTHFADSVLAGKEPVLTGLNGLLNQRVLDQSMIRYRT